MSTVPDKAIGHFANINEFQFDPSMSKKKSLDSGVDPMSVLRMISTRNKKSRLSDANVQKEPSLASSDSQSDSIKLQIESESDRQSCRVYLICSVMLDWLRSTVKHPKMNLDRLIL